MSTFDSGRQFFVDPFTAQTFYWEPVNGVYSPWAPLNPSDYHLPRPEVHNVPTCLPENLGSVPTDPVLATTSHAYMGSDDSQPPPPTQASQALPPDTTTSVLQNPAQTGGDLRRTQRLMRSYDPVRGQRAGHLHEGRRGRTRGSPNYKFREVDVLLDLVEEELPIASKGWRIVGSRFRDWAVIAQHPARTDRSLELKFKQLVKTRKPTGDAVCPPHVRRAHEIDHKLQSKVACRDLEDGDIIEIDNEGNVSDDEMSDSYDTNRNSPTCDKPIPRGRRVRTVRVEAPVLSQDSTRQSSSKGTDILEKISKTLDPEAQSRREADRASSMFQTQQLILLQSQIRDLNSTILSLRNQLDDSERRRIDADRRADRLQNQIDITSAVTRARLYRSTTRTPRHATPISISSTPESTPDRDHRWEATFRDGGHCSWSGNGNRFDRDGDVVEVTRVPWSPPPRSPTQSPFPNYETESEL